MKTFKQYLREQENNTLYFTFGRFDPPTLGHRALITNIKEKAENNLWMIFPSRTTDKKKSFLEIDDKINFMQELYPDYSEHIINDSRIRTVINIFEHYQYSNYVLIVGAPDVEAMSKFIPYAPKGSTLKVLSGGNRNADAVDTVESMSSSKLKGFVVNGDKDSFIAGIGNPEIGEQIWNKLEPYKEQLAKYIAKKG